MTSMRALLTLAGAVLACALVAPAAASAEPLRNDLRGVQIVGVTANTEIADIDNDLGRARALGAKVVRSEVRWDVAEPSPGVLDEAYLAKADHLMAAARAAGIKVFLTVLGTPCWTSTSPAPDCATAQGREEAAFWPPADYAAFGRIAAVIAARWSTTLAALEIWNEPDQSNELYWKGPDKVRNYVALLKAAYPAIKAAAPKVRVAGAAIVGGNGRFLKALYDAGAKGSWDLLSVHYYDLVLLSLGDIRKVRDAAGDRSKIWLGEYGWTSCLTAGRLKQDQHSCVSRGVQATNTLDALRVLRRQRDLAGATLYSLRDTGQYDFGTLEQTGAEKPLFRALSAAFRGRIGRERAITLRLTASRGRVVASGGGPAGDAYVLEAYRKGRLRYAVAFRQDRANRFLVRLPAKLGTRGLRVRVHRYTVGGRGTTRTI